MQWHVTERCNLRCAHCYQESYASEELRLDNLLRILKQFKDLLHLWRAKAGRRVRGHITITGGEPFIREDFPDLLEVLARHRNCFSFAILTNGTCIDSSIARRLHKLSPEFVQISVEGTQTTHDEIRGKGNFDRTVEAIKTLVRERIRTFVSFTAHRGNFRDFGEVALLARRLQVARVWADRLIPSGSGSNLAKHILTPSETLELFQIMHKARRDAARQWFGRTEVSMHRALEFLLGGGTPYHCTAGDALVTVMPNGDVYPCRRMPLRVGNLLEKPLAELYYDSDFLCALRDKTTCSEGCENCSYVALCRGGLRCLSYAISNNPFKADPGCWLARH